MGRLGFGRPSGRVGLTAPRRGWSGLDTLVKPEDDEERRARQSNACAGGYRRLAFSLGRGWPSEVRSDEG